jgi:hypothetical protein
MWVFDVGAWVSDTSHHLLRAAQATKSLRHRVDRSPNTNVHGTNKCLKIGCEKTLLLSTRIRTAGGRQSLLSNFLLSIKLFHTLLLVNALSSTCVCCSVCDFEVPRKWDNCCYYYCCCSYFSLLNMLTDVIKTFSLFKLRQSGNEHFVLYIGM